MITLLDALGIRRFFERLAAWFITDGKRLKSDHKLALILVIAFGLLIGYTIAGTLPNVDFRSYIVGVLVGVLVCYSVRAIWQIATYKDVTQ